MKIYIILVIIHTLSETIEKIYKKSGILVNMNGGHGQFKDTNDLTQENQCL